MTSIQIQPSIPEIKKINVDSEKPCYKRLLLLIQPSASVRFSSGHTSVSNSDSKINCGVSFSNSSLNTLLANKCVSSSIHTKPSLGPSQQTKLQMKTYDYKPVTTNNIQQLLLPANHFIITQNLNQTNIKSKSHTTISTDLGKEKAQQVGKEALKNDEKKLHKTDAISKEEEPVCSICDVRFWTKELFDSHFEGKQFSCRICTSGFSTHSELECHFLSHPNYKCLQCKEVFLTKKDLCNHKRDVCIPKQECIICNKKYSSSNSLILHQRNVHYNGVEKYQCVVCDKMCSSPYKLQDHQRRTHVAYERIKCKLCTAYFLGPERLKFHVKVCHLKKKEASPVPCPICGKVFAMDYHLSSHIRYTHTDTCEILCEYCGQSCKGRRSLFGHFKRYHKGLRNYKRPADGSKIVPAMCEICGKTLKNKYQLRTHLQIHSNERQFKCDICNATFKQEAALRNHRTTHSTIYYTCSYCEKQFKWKHSFKKHEVKCKIAMA